MLKDFSGSPLPQGFEALQHDLPERMCYIVTDKELVQETKEYFSQIRKTDRLIQRLSDTVATLRSNLTSQSYELKPDKVQTSGPKDTLADTIAKIIDLENKINARIDEIVDMKREAFKMISVIHDLDQQNVLIGRYIQLKKWDDLAAEFEWSSQWLFEIHGKGLLAFSHAHEIFLENRVKQRATG